MAVSASASVHHVEDEPQLGEEVAHGLGDAGALRQRGHRLVEVHVGRADVDPPVRGGGRLALLDGCPHRGEQALPLVAALG